MGTVYEALLRAEARRSELEASGGTPEGGEALGDSGEIRWEGAIFERVTSIERQLATLEESVAKRVPEVEERLLHLLESRLASLEAELHRATSSLASDLAFESERSRSDQRRILWALAVVGVLVLLF